MISRGTTWSQWNLAILTDYTTCLNVPSVDLVVGGDAAYNDVHLYLAESNAKSRQEWISALDKIESLNPCAVIAAHKRPGNDDNPRIIEETKEVHMRFRPDSRNDDNRAGALQQDARAISKSGQSGVGNLEFGACSQTVI